MLALPIPLRLLLAAQPKLVTPVLQLVHRVITRNLLGQAGVKADEADSGAVPLIQRFGSAANLNIHLHCLVLDGVYRCDTEGEAARELGGVCSGKKGGLKSPSSILSSAGRPTTTTALAAVRR